MEVFVLLEVLLEAFEQPLTANPAITAIKRKGFMWMRQNSISFTATEQNESSLLRSAGTESSRPKFQLSHNEFKTTWLLQRR
jgi:hypothetical protein